MVRPKFSFRIKDPAKAYPTTLSPSPNAPAWQKRKNVAYAKVNRDNINKKNQQMEDALRWCQENNKRGWAALNTGLFPLIKDRRSINDRLDGKIKHGAEREYCSILTNKEEEILVEHVKNKNRCYQGMNRKGITDAVMDILELRKHTLRKHRGRVGTPLSTHAENALKTKKLSKSFWKRWDTKHQSLGKKRQGNVAMNRAMNCTREMAVKHLDELAEELISAGIFTNASQIIPGKWRGQIDLSRIFNHDETPQFVNYGVDPTSHGLVYAGKGDECKQMIRENRECVTVHPFVSLSGEMIMCHVIFKGQGITSQMVPDKEVVDKIDKLLISTTEHGVQDHNSLLDAYTYFDEIITTKAVQKPVCVLSDGHSSRFDLDVMKLMADNSDRVFIGPPDTTGVTQVLDQINQRLHSRYRYHKKDLFAENGTINRDGFMRILAEVWTEWAPSDTIVKSAKRCGISEDGLDVEWMQTEKFESAKLCTESPSTPDTTAPVVSSPVGVRKNSARYFKHKYEESETLRHKLLEQEIEIDKVPGLLKVQKVKPVTNKKTIRVTQVCGSMTGKNILETLKDLKEKADEMDKKKQATKDKKERDLENFLRCRDVCVCSSIPCCAKKLKQCPSCRNVMKSVCSKVACRNEDGSKPNMIVSTAIKPTSCKRKLLSIYNEESSDDGDHIDDEVYESEDDDLNNVDFVPVQYSGSRKTKETVPEDSVLKGTWKSLSPPVPEKEIIGKWYGLIYVTKKRKLLYIGKVIQRFLLDEGGPVDVITMQCLKPKTGSGTILEDTPDHLPDIGDYSLSDIIAGPLTVIPKGAKHFDVPRYEEVKALYDSVKNIDRDILLS